MQGVGASWPPMMSLCQYYLSTAENSNRSREEARGHASDVWREGRRGRGTETRHRRLENNGQTTGKESVDYVDNNFTLLIII